MKLVLPQKLAPHIREAIVKAPLMSSNIWNIDAEQNKALSDLKIKTEQQHFFLSHPRFGKGRRLFRGQRDRGAWDSRN